MAKMVKCKTCGEMMAKSAKRCPHCGARKKMPVGASIACVLIIVVTVFAVVAILSSGDTSGGTTNQTAQESKASESVEKETALLDDDYIAASYIKAYEADGVDGVFYLQLSVENKSDKEVMVALSSASVNGVSTQAMSGVPMVIQPGKESLNPFIFSYSTLNISTVDELEDISFKFTVFDNATMSTLEETEAVSITF